MPYVSLDNLSQFWGNAKKYIDARDACYANWHRTETAGIVTCCPVPESELHPVVNFSFTETLPAEGEKGPDNPSTIAGVSGINVYSKGKNLLYYPLDALTKTITGVTFTYNGNGSFTANGTSTQNPVMYRIAEASNNATAYSFLPAGTYTLSGCPDESNTTIRLIDSEGGLVFRDNQGNQVYTDSGTPRTFTIDKPAYVFCMIRIGKDAGTAISNLTFAPQLEIGDTKTALQPAVSHKHTINLNGTYYGGSIDLSTGLMTVTWSGIIYTGEENITSETAADGVYQYGLPAPSYAFHHLNCSCTHLVTGGTVGDRFYVRSSGGAGVRFFVSEYATVNDVKAWLASQYANGTPVVVAYQLASPHTVQLTPQQIKALPALDRHEPRINTLYTDADSIQVSYQKSPIQTERELTNAILALGSN